MIVTEFMTINGKAFVRTYSDSALMVKRDGVRYVEAIDPAKFGRVFTETDEPIEYGLTEIEEKAKAYDVIMGVAK